MREIALESTFTQIQVVTKGAVFPPPECEKRIKVWKSLQIPCWRETTTMDDKCAEILTIREDGPSKNLRR
ncbi:hypothetical protein KIN20_000432 [Parelaphostrongylus tenuis]|uniref:Uncharacterized protein n=1 Tax=Parelaphostrongylus tenuis TaxID=148309 RepID=A0AAD5LW40_PARTN|nr:hypothetical protein KIN20_000432 [Parelaphostrongylus tenuis]